MRAQTATIVAHYDAIWIKHGNNFENEAVSEGFCYRVLTKQELKQALHDKRAVALSWMHSASQDHALSLRYVILRSLKIGNNEHFQIVPRRLLHGTTGHHTTKSNMLESFYINKLGQQLLSQN